MSTTKLAIDGIEFVSHSTRGLTQTLGTIEEAQNSRRSINGVKVYVSAPQFQKFTSEITCTDQAAPQWVWPGTVVTVDCAAQLNYGPGGSAIRPVVPGSTYTSNGHTFYRPQLQMMVMNMTTEEDEYGATISWTLSLEEV